MSEKQTGGISVNTQNIFPIIKKWLYSEKDIFLRELVSNATDAITKLKRLQSLGEIEAYAEPFRIDVTLDREAKTLTVEDNGIGMTAEEVEKYICSIALSGAVDFLEKYEGESSSEKSGIIGHFGLGFYSAFMVSDTVEIHTRSFTGAPAVHWTCNAEGQYEMADDGREARGTEIVLHVNEEESAYLNPNKIREMLQKYCAFMPVEIYFDDGSEKAEDAPVSPINDTTPLWQKPISECTEEDYKDFYKQVFSDYRDPLFQIHLNADYPLNFKGILYFPRLDRQRESLEGEVKLYYNQVFVADNIKEVIPDYLLMLRGVLDCPELPLNVSRSYLQTNSYVSKLSAHIGKKVADKLVSLCKNEREYYERVWGDIRIFAEYASLRDEKFYDRLKDATLLKLTSGKYVTLPEYLEANKDKQENTVYYTTDPALQAPYVNLYTAQGFEIAVLDEMIDTHFISLVEAKREGVKFCRVDAALAETLKNGESEANDALCDLFRSVCNVSGMEILPQALKDSDTPVLCCIPEQERRMQDAMRFYRMASNQENEEGEEDLLLQSSRLLLNTNAPLIQKLNVLLEQNAARAKQLASYLFRLAMLSYRQFTAEEMQSFLNESYALLALLS